LGERGKNEKKLKPEQRAGNRVELANSPDEGSFKTVNNWPFVERGGERRGGNGGWGVEGETNWGREGPE